MGKPSEDPPACDHRRQRVRSLGDIDENQEVVCLDCDAVLGHSETVQHLDDHPDHAGDPAHD